MINLSITKPLLKSQNSELIEDDKAKLAVFISNFSQWRGSYKEHLKSPVTYEQVSKLHSDIEYQLEHEGQDGHSMLEKALAALN